MAKLDNPSLEDLTALVKSNHYLLNDDSKIGEGIVIKNYNYHNRYGRMVYAKIVVEEFFSTKKDNHKKKTATIQDEDALIAAIVETFLTESMINKEYEKLAEELNLERQEVKREKIIGLLFNRVWHEFLVEETPAFVKKFKLPIVNFKALRKEVENKVKQVKSSLF